MDRRKFVGGAAAASGLLLLKPRTVFGYEANSAVRLALLGCGSRGTSVATSFANDTNTRVVALADLFPDKLALAKTHLDQVADTAGYAKVDPSRMFRGYKAFEEVASSPDVDAVQISTPPWFHVQHLDAAVRGGKHVYCEKPIGVDVAQSKQALEIGKRAQGKVSLEVGFQIRSAPPFVEIVRRIQQGALGKIGAVAAHYNAPASTYPPMPNMSADELRIRRWYWDRVLSGDIIVEQAIHLIDICNWALQAHPTRRRRRWKKYPDSPRQHMGQLRGCVYLSGKRPCQLLLYAIWSQRLVRCFGTGDRRGGHGRGSLLRAAADPG